MISLAMNALSQLPPEDPAVDPIGLMQLLYDSFLVGNYWLAASAAVVVVVWAIRTFGSKFIPSIEPILKHPIVSFLLPLVITSVMALIASLSTGGDVKAALLAALKVAMGAIFAYVGLKKIQEAREAGQDAADAIKTTSDALNVLGGRVKK